MKNKLVQITDVLLTDDLVKELYTFVKLTDDTEKMLSCFMIVVTGDREFADIDKKFNWPKT